MLLPACTVPRKEPIDADHYPLQITKLRGGIYVVEDPNYWKTNSVFYVAPEGILFLGSGWTSKSAAQILWKAATLSYQEFIAVVPVSAGLHHTGGLWEFRKQRVPILLTAAISDNAAARWEAWNLRMQSFGSWKTMEHPRADDYIAFDASGRLEMLGGKVVLISPGPSSSPDAIAAYFPAEKVLYAGDMLADPDYFVEAQPGARQNIQKLQSLDFDTIVSGHGEAVRTRPFFTQTWSFR